MFLLGRVGPSHTRRAVAAGAPHGVRFGGTKKIAAKPKDPNAKKKGDIERDSMGRPIFKPREKSLGTFRPLAPGTLTHELFESDKRAELSLPTFDRQSLKAGTMTAFEPQKNSPLRAYGLPTRMLLETAIEPSCGGAPPLYPLRILDTNPLPQFRVLSKPCSLIRATTLSLIRALEESKSKFASLVLNGRSGCGKSFLLLQAAEYATATGWIVLYIPRAKQLVNSSTTFTYSLATQTYLQPVFARQTLQRFAAANAAQLALLRTAAPALIDGRTVPAGTPLTELIALGVADASAAPAALDALLSALAAQERFPVLLAIDDFQALFGHSHYRDPHFRLIRPHHLSMPRLLLEFASGRRSFPRGAVLGALTSSDTQFPVPLQLREALRLPPDASPSPISPYARRSAQLAAYLRAPPPPPPPATPAPTSKRNKPTEADEARRKAEEAELRRERRAQESWRTWRTWPAPVFEADVVGAPAHTGVDLEYDDDDDAGLTKATPKLKVKGGAPLMRAIRVPERLSTEEALALFEVWMQDRALITENLDEMFMTKYAESSGNPREFVWKGLLATLQT
ncbi:mitochondrial ribosomal death-associated protein 3-domain-containing protein [Mycena sp. CBHHK59/15]|nr:mitochondrial ribosomal death-associated protein 3-domain-containing protein [Mycena sp. CBHHK59/15]